MTTRRQDTMKKNVLLFLLIAGIASPMLLSSCQRDDICSEDPTTPNLVVGFFDFVNQDEFNRVTNLRVTEVNDDLESTLITESTVSVDSILLPLRTFTSSTRYVMVRNAGFDADGNEQGDIDTLTFNYTVEERFISRGCGVTANFTLNGIDVTTDDDNWIVTTEIVNPVIEDETEIHVKIFHN